MSGSEVRLPDSFLTSWFRQHSRRFAWRERGIDPFHLLVAEVLLRQTRATSVERIWTTLVRDYPTAEALGNADKSEIEQRLTPLGFQRQRATSLIELSGFVVANLRGQVPRDIRALRRMPHMGIYGAHAMACFAFNTRCAIVDSNVLRLHARLHGRAVLSEIRRAPEVWTWADEQLPQRNYRIHNYGMLDFTADVCRPRAPRWRTVRASCRCQTGRQFSAGFDS